MDNPPVYNESPGVKEADPNTPKSRKTFCALWRDFADRTSMHGLGRAVLSKMTWRKIIWSILVIGAANFAGRNLVETIQSYLKYPAATYVELDYQTKMSFPAVTICNLNPARYASLHPDIKKALNESETRGDSVDRQKQIYKMMLYKMYAKNENRTRESLYYSMTDMIVSCMFDTMECTADDFVSFLSYKYGRCYTFNRDQELVREIYKAGNANGLILELDIQEDQYLPFISTAGIKVLIHPQTDAAFPEDSGITAGPGRATSIGIRKMSVERQPQPWGKCIKKEDINNEEVNMYSGDLEYTTAVCEKTCYQRTIFEACYCCDENYPCNDEALFKITGIKTDGYIEFCDESNKTLLECMKDIRTQYFSGYLPCMDTCRPPCSETMYRTNYATASWPGTNFMNNLVRKAKESMKTKGKTFNVYPDPMTNEFITTNFLRLEVYFENFHVEKTIALPAYDWNKLLSDLGGQLGLWLGFSLMTAVEILELIYDILTYKCKSKCQKKTKTPQAETLMS